MRFGRVIGIFTAPLAIGACRESSPTGVRSGSTTPEFIVNGEPTGSSYSSVGALLFDFDANGKLNGDDEWCTGSLVAPDVFLTAAHCIVTPYTPPGTQFYVSFAPDL